MISIGGMIQRISGLQESGELTAWECEFVASVLDRTANGKRTTNLSERQVEIVERIFNKHFAG